MTTFAHNLVPGETLVGHGLIAAADYLAPTVHIIGTTGDLSQSILRFTFTDGSTLDAGPMDVVEYLPVTPKESN